MELLKLINWSLLSLWCLHVQGFFHTANAVPKEYQNRQILPHIPGYIPVYIQHGDTPPSHHFWKSTQKHKNKNKPFKSNEHKTKHYEEDKATRSVQKTNEDKVTNHFDRHVELKNDKPRQVHGDSHRVTVRFNKDKHHRDNKF